MQLERAKRKLKMLRYPTKSGKNFPLTHSEGKFLNKYRRHLTIYRLGRDPGCSSYKNSQQDHLNTQGREQRPEVEVSNPKKYKEKW